MLELVDVAKIYDQARRSGAVVALDRVNLTIEAGEFCALLGPSGSGKSTLMNIVGLLDLPTAGTYRLAGADVASLDSDRIATFRNALIGFVFQSFQLLGRLSVWENVALPLLYRGVPRQERREPAAAMLAHVGLAGMEERRPSELSGGQQQRVAIARALVGHPKLLLADEPTGNLDSVTANEIITLFTELNRTTGVTIVMVTHDAALAARCSRQIHILDGRIVDDVAGGAARRKTAVPA